MIPSFRLLLPALALTALTGAQADPLTELNAFSNIKGVNLETLAKGKVNTGNMPPMKFARGLGVEGCYIVHKPLARTAELHAQWTPTRHPDLKAYLHGDLSGHPAAGEFAKLSSAPGNSAVKGFVAETLKLAAGGTRLQLSNAEAKAFSGDGSGAMPISVVTFWSNVLAQRAQAYTSGGLGKLPPYETTGGTVRAGDDLAQLLKESEKVRAQFSGLIGSTPLGGGKGSPSLFWDMFNDDDRAAVSLGASYTKQSATGVQVVEIQYYASGGFYGMLSFYQMWPVNIGGQDATLVWRGDLISSEALAAQKGTERLAASGIMRKETQKSIEAFLSDVSKAP